MEFALKMEVTWIVVAQMDFMVKDVNSVSLAFKLISNSFKLIILFLKDDYCLNNKCVNNDKCVSNSNGYKCICKSGFDGVYCQNCNIFLLI